jgi:hypothetical protein
LTQSVCTVNFHLISAHPSLRETCMPMRSLCRVCPRVLARARPLIIVYVCV